MTAQALREYTREEALSSLINPGQLKTSVGALARQWGRNRMWVTRRLDEWEQQGLIRRDRVRGGLSVINVGTVNVQVNNHPNAIEQVPATVPKRAGLTSGRLAARSLSIVLAALAATLAWYGVRINAWYGHSLGRTPEAAHLLGGLNVIGDIVAALLPTVAAIMWRSGQPIQAAVAWTMAGCLAGFALLANVGFTALNTSDTRAERSRTVETAASLAGRIERLTADRAAVTERRSVDTLAAAIQAAQANAAPVWHATHECTDVTRSRSAEQCAPVQSLRQAFGEATRRDRLDAELRAAQSELSKLPAVTTADPQAEAMAELVNWSPAGRFVTVTPADIGQTRTAGFGLLPLCAGFILMFAQGLWRVE